MNGGLLLALVCAEAFAAHPPDARLLDSLRDLNRLAADYAAQRPIGRKERDAAWTALWASEKVLSEEVLAQLRQLLLAVDEQTGPLRGLARQDSPAPDPRDVAGEVRRDKLYHAVDKLKYPPEIKRILSLIVDDAAPDDAELALDVVKREKPVIELRSELLGLDTVGELMGSRSGSRIELRPGVALLRAASPEPGTAQLTAGSSRYDPIPSDEAYYRRLSLPVPPLDVFNPQARSRPAGAYFGGQVFVYPDGSGYHHFSNEHLAGVLLHELMHLDTRRRGGGANTKANELRSFLAQFRLYYNVQKRLGTADFLDLNRQGYANWLENPVSLGYFLEAAYGERESQPGGPDVFEQLDETRRVLALSGPDFENASKLALEARLANEAADRRSELGYLARLGLAKDPAPADPPSEDQLRLAAEGWDFRRELQDTLARLSVDAELQLEARLQDFTWRHDNGLDRRESLTLHSR